METVNTLAIDDLRTLLPDWKRSLRARNRTPGTIASYLRCGQALADFLVSQGMPTTASAIAREHIESAIVGMQDRGLSAATVAKHYRSWQQLFRWLLEDGEIERSPMERMSPPTVPEVPVPVLTDDEIRRLLKACSGNDFEARRDTAIIRLFDDTGIRLGELAGIELDGVDRDQEIVHVVGKGRRPRNVPYGPKVADALRRYLRVRAGHPKAGATALWLGKRGPMTESGIAQMLQRRGEEAGVPDVHPHRFRHTFAHNWMAADNGEVNLMRLAGWKSRQMLSRYAASAADERAREAHKRANLGGRL